MEISLEAIIALITLLSGGSCIGGFVFWKQTKRRAKAEAALAEAEAKLKDADVKSAEVAISQKIQDTYQEMLEDKNKEVEDNRRLIAELREDRDHYKKGYVEMRDEMERLAKDFYQFKRDTMNEREKMKKDISRNTRIAESSRPFMCGLAPDCPKCVPVIISDEGTVKPKKKGKAKAADIEPSNEVL
jgi:flagellar biosynthesis GTPase FlhF